MPYTEEQLQYMAQFSPHIRMMLKAKYWKQIEEEERRRKEEIMAQAHIPTEAEIQEDLKKLASYNPYHDLKMQPRQHIPRDPQPFYTKFLNKRKNRNKRK